MTTGAAQVAAAVALLRPLEAKQREERKAAKRREHEQNSSFRAGFGRALNQGLEVGSPPLSARRDPSSCHATLGAVPPSLSEAGMQAAMQTGWANGLSADKQREWLCDCYRMRVDDDMCWGGGFLHG